MEHDDFDDMIDSLTDEETIEELVEEGEEAEDEEDEARVINDGDETLIAVADETHDLTSETSKEQRVRELCQNKPLSELASVPMVDLAVTTETNLSQRIEQAIESGHVDAVVADSERTQSSKDESASPESSTAAPDAAVSPNRPVDPKLVGTLNPFYYDSLNPPEYYENRKISHNPIAGYYIPPPELIKWDLAEEERAVFLTEQQVYLADVAKGGHYEAACAAIKRIHALERGIKLAAHAVFSLRQSFIEDSLHRLSGDQKAEYDKLDVAEREKYLKKVARKQKMPGLVNKAGVIAPTSDSKSAQAKLAAAARSQAKKIIDGYYQLALSEEQDMAEAAKEVMKKLENKGLLTDIAKMMIKKLFV